MSIAQPFSLSVSDEDLRRLVTLTHPDPHAVLGAHPTPRGVVVRAFRPEAVGVKLLIDSERPLTMTKTNSMGLFELLVENHKDVFPYRLEFFYANGNAYTMRDPYTFLPTLTKFDEHLFGEGKHLQIYEKLGAHVEKLGDVEGVSFAVWSPNADGVSVVGDFNSWDGRLHQMRRLGTSGIWEIFVPDLHVDTLYKFEIHRASTPPFLKTDPYAQYAEVPPATSSIVYESSYTFQDEAWLKERARRDYQRRPVSIYEVHLGSWRRITEENNRSFSYRETAEALTEYLLDMNFTHVEFMPLKGHPYGGSWGYQVGNYYAPTARFGTPDDFRFLVDYLHQHNLGVIMDWVPAHFPKDAFALGRFDGTALYEHLDPRKGEHPDWGTYIFNFGRNEVKNFLLANALFWLNECHVDGLRVDAVASMLYLDYSRNDGRWIPNRYGGRENLEAIEFLKELNFLVHEHAPGALMIAEESTSYPQVSHPIQDGGLGFDFKWNMGWMHDTLQYFSKDAIYRRFHHNNLTFGLFYAWSENFILPFSHDEVVHLKGSMLNKMFGLNREEKFANLRALYGCMWAHPGKKLLFMGDELGQWREWNDDQSLDWHLVDEPLHHGVQSLVRDLNYQYRLEPALWEADIEPAGFHWIDGDNAGDNVLSFMRIAPALNRRLVCVSNFSNMTRENYRIGLPASGIYTRILDTNAPAYTGENPSPDELPASEIHTEEIAWQGQPFSAIITLPPLSTQWFEVPFTA
ncbi:MAG: 1,4-alpha-glucan branching protein GlgB [Pyrinomonadaceae bacterium]